MKEVKLVNPGRLHIYAPRETEKLEAYNGLNILSGPFGGIAVQLIELSVRLW